MTREEIEALATDLVQRAPHEAAELLARHDDTDALCALEQINPWVAQQILRQVDTERRDKILHAAPSERAQQWKRNQVYPEDSIGWLMEPPVAVFRPQMTVRETVEALRKLTKRAFITYGYVTDAENRLLGGLVFRDLMLAAPEQTLAEVMFTDVFSLSPSMALTDAMKATLNRHYPVYPVCDEAGGLLGLVRGQTLFEARAIELSAQPGSIVGVDESERLTTPVGRSLRLRHPWLQFNLFTAFFAAGIIAFCQDTLDRVVILAAFLPVMSGQASNTGCQALAVCLRGLALGDFRSGQESILLFKETLLGFYNGLFTGLVAAAGMFLYATWQPDGSSSPMALAATVFVAMTLSCVISGIAGTAIPLLLKRMNLDPATASGIFLTTVTDCISIGSFLMLASWLVR
jgi:magnesium transporter